MSHQLPNQDALLWDGQQLTEAGREVFMAWSLGRLFDREATDYEAAKDMLEMRLGTLGVEIEDLEHIVTAAFGDTPNE